MFLTLILIFIISAGGFALTYLWSDDDPFMWRLAAGHIAGSAVFGLVCFGLASMIGLELVSIAIAAVITALPLLLLRGGQRRKIFRHDWDKAKGQTERFTWSRVRNVAYYGFFLILFAAFFDRAMIVTDNGIFTGASNNLGDLPFHLGAIFGFSDGNNFPPQNPSFSGARFSYPFIADFLTASLVKLGASVKAAMLLQNTVWAFSLLVVLERFAAALTKSRLAGKIAPFLLFFSGGLGFIWFLKDYWEGALGFFEILWNLPRDYTIGDHFRWGNSMVVLFITQRSMLLGMPLTIIVLHYLRRIFLGEEPPSEAESKKRKHSYESGRFPAVPASLVVGILAGTLPLIHAHSLFVLFVVSAFLLVFSLSGWKNWFAFAAGTALTSIPILAWVLTGSATSTNEFIAWHFGFDARELNIAWFWLKNTGLFIPLVFAGLFLISRFLHNVNGGEEGGDDRPVLRIDYILFALPFFVLFVVSNIFKFAPWEWDNIKVLIYWFVGTLPFAAYAIALIWQKGKWFTAAAGVLLIVLTFAGALDVWRTASAQMEYAVFDKDAVEIAKAIRERTPPGTLFLNAPTYNTAVVLSGRRSLMRYTGHLSSHGIDYREREEDLKKIYAGEATAEILLKKYGIEYVLVSPLEKQDMTVNESFLNSLELFAEAGDYKVYKVRLR